MRLLKIALGAIVVLAVLYLAIRLYPTPLEWLLADRDPAILDGHTEQPGAFEGNILPAVLRRHPGVGTEQGLVAELTTERFKIDRAHRTAWIKWSSTHCENWLTLDWTASPGGAVQTLQKDWQAGCDEY